MSEQSRDREQSEIVCACVSESRAENREVECVLEQCRAEHCRAVQSSAEQRECVC